jgi:putative transposase
MSDYRRYFVPGGTYFFTLVCFRRRAVFNQSVGRRILGRVMRDCKSRWPYETNAIILLPDHLHAIWTLPRGDAEYPKRWGWIKKEFTKAWLEGGGHDLPVTAASAREQRRGVWQTKYREHTIDDVEDFEAHFDYVHFNAVKHGYVTRAADWPWSSFHRWVELGHYPKQWAETTPPKRLEVLDGKVGEP